jgi:glyoxylase-like metal-dependent hydrolase (beta-lactamase superfamily II)
MPRNYLHSGEIVSFGNHQLKVISTPGHSPGSVVFHCWEEKIAFTGDTLFSMSIGRTDFPGSDKEQMAESLGLIVHRLSDETIIYPGHGRKSTMAHEKACNPYL